MRLTLRTLLAYLDHVLDSNDARELESKIRESKLARHTMERIDKGLASPNPATPSAGEQDPNVLAEYLDNMLPPEQVPQFERLCFENDAHLIEAASVHRILSVVVTRPVHVSKALSTRLKGLVADKPAGNAATQAAVVQPTAEVVQAAPANAAGAAAKVESNGHASAARLTDAVPLSATDSQTRTVASLGPHGLDMSDRHTNSVPEYLRGRSDAIYYQAAIAALLLIALGLVAWVSVGPFDELSNLFKSKPVVVAGALDEVEKATDKTIKPNVKSTTIVVDEVVPPLPDKDKSPAAASVKDKSAEDKTAKKSDAIIETDDVAPPVVPNPDKKIPTEVAASDPIAEANVAPPASPASPTETASIENSLITGDVAGSNAAPPIPTPASPVAEPTAKSPIIWQPENKDSTSAIVMALAIDDQGKRSVRLVNISESLPLSTRLIVPDSYRTELRVAPGLKWVVSSASDLQGDGGEDPSIAYVRMRLGRALLHATADCSKAIIKVGAEEFKVVMDSPTAIASIEVRYFPMPGAKIEPNLIRPESAKRPHMIPNFLLPVISIGSIAGNVQIQSKYGVSWSDPVVCESGSVLGFVDGQQKGPHMLAELPWWYRTSIERPIDAGAANDLALELQAAPAGAPANDAAAAADAAKKEDLLDILSQSTHARRSETAALAARTLALLGNYESLFGKDAVMSVASSRPHRTLILDSLIQSLGIGPANATNLISVLSNYDPPRGSRMLNIMGLPDAKELTVPEGAQPYVDALSSSYLDERAIAIYQLTKITGKEFAYQADRVTSEALANWRKIYASGRIEWNVGSIKPLEWDTNQ